MTTPSNDVPRILVVEDEPDIRETVTFYIESEFTAKVVEAENGKIAKDILKADPNFKIVVSDLNMPEMSGAALLKFIREENLPLKFILLSGESKLNNELQGHEPDAIVEKPLFTAPLKNALSKFLQRKMD